MARNARPCARFTVCVARKNAEVVRPVRDDLAVNAGKRFWFVKIIQRSTLSPSALVKVLRSRQIFPAVSRCASHLRFKRLRIPVIQRHYRANTGPGE
jgi:hypothetical protein